jgi:hypothetical protein
LSTEIALRILCNATRRDRKQWLSQAFVSQNPGQLWREIFERCYTRRMHTVRSTRTLDALIATNCDVTREHWASCPPLANG